MTTTERSIVTAAKKVFLKKGLEGASMRDIAEEAGISRPSLHYYHRTKHALFLAILVHAVGEIIPKISAVIQSDLPLTVKLERIIDSYHPILLDNPLLPQFFIIELQRDPDNLIRLLQEKTNVFDLLGFLEHQIGSELNLPLPPKRALIHLFSSIYGLLFLPFLAKPVLDEVAFGHDPAQFEQFIQERKPIIVAMVSAVLKPQGRKEGANL